MTSRQACDWRWDGTFAVVKCQAFECFPFLDAPDELSGAVRTEAASARLRCVSVLATKAAGFSSAVSCELIAVVSELFMGERSQTFRARLTSGEPLLGTFVKTPSSMLCEVLSLASLDVVCLDVEHAPFGRLEIDACIAALRALDQPSLVRLSTDSPAAIREALDCGATGILVPHVTSVAQARAIVQASRFGEGGRGYSGSTRAAGFGTRSLTEHLHASRDETTVILQLEDAAAIDVAGSIAAVEGVDAVFIGRIDLAVSLKQDPLSREVVAAVGAICAAGRSAGKAVGMFAPSVDEVPRWRAAGASLFLLSSDQSLILSGARELAAAFRTACGTAR
jgi:2-keto-3-deoxy-L-rhamnonate aldolase RhmA